MELINGSGEGWEDWEDGWTKADNLGTGDDDDLE